MMGTAEEMKELISKGTFMAFENRVYLAGACNVGKSTLASILLGEEIPQRWKSTDGLVIYFGRNGIDLKDKTMIPLKKGFDGDVLSKVLRGQPDIKQEKHPSKYDKSLPEIEKKMRSPPANKKKMTSEKHPTAESKAILSEKTDTELVKGARNKDTHKGLSKPQLQAQKMSKQSYITIHEDIKEELRKGNYKVNIAPSDLVDFGGQRSFDMTHQLFIQHKGEFILMFNGKFDLCDPLPEYPQGDVTTESILKHWVSSILSYCADDDDILPIILFAATHSDFYTQKDRIDRSKKLTKDLQEMFQNHEQHKRIIFDDIFFINGKDENDPEIDRLKTRLVEVAFRQNSWGKRMPMAWVPLDLQLSEMRSDNTTLISKEDLTALNRSNEDLALTDTQIEHFLKAQHSLGKILYFDQHGLEKFIIVQPQSLVNILRSFITDEHFWPDDESLRDILRAMINTGEIAKKDLLKLWSQKEVDQHMPNNDLKEFIIQVLVHLDILVEPKRYSQEQKSIVQSYLVPCIVKRKLPVTDVYYKSKEDKMICLSYKLLKSSIPAALSFKLIGAAINVWPLMETPEGVCLYHQAAILCIDGSNELHLLVEDDKIFVYLINKVAKRFIPPNIASAVQECLTLTMTKVLEFYHKSLGKSLSTSEVSKAFAIEVGEWCTSGGCCYISVPEVKEKTEWLCQNNRTHQAKYPLYWIVDKLFMHQFAMMGTSDEIKKLLSKGTFASYENCVYLAGACNVGKSTLASILIGEKIPQQWKSTDGLVIYFGRNGIDLENRKMVPLKQDYDGDVLSKVLRGKPNMTEENCDTTPSKIRKEVKSDTNLSKNREEVKPDTTLSKNKEEVLLHDSNKGYIITPETHAIPQGKDITVSPNTTLVNDVNTTDLPTQQSQPNYIIAAMQEDIKEKIKDGTYEMNIAPSDLVDFGGQRSFDMTHQLFIRYKGTFVLMFNGNIGFSVPLEHHEPGETTELILKHWVNSILSFCVDDDEDLPTIMFAATHSDEVKHKEDSKKKFIDKLREWFGEHKWKNRIRYNDIFFIDGRKKEDPEINRLKSELVNVAFEQKSWGQQMPLAWVPLNLQMSELRLHNMNIISKEELITLNQRNEELELKNDTDINFFLIFQHSLGKILYFDQPGLDHFIIVQPQSLVHILRSFITAEKFWPKDEKMRGILDTLTKKGEITKQDLLTLWSQKDFERHMPNDYCKEFIIQVLVHLDILVEPRQYKPESYLVPCMVKRQPKTDFEPSDKMMFLSYRPLQPPIPAALTFRLIGAAINVWPLEKSQSDISLYHQAALFHIDDKYNLHLSVKDDKICVYLRSEEGKDSIEPQLAPTIQEYLTMTIAKIVKFYHKSFGKSSEVSKVFELEVGELCTSGKVCYISVPEVQKQTDWICTYEKPHNKKYPRLWIFDKKDCGEYCSGPKDLKLLPTDKHLFRLAESIYGNDNHCSKFFEKLGLLPACWNQLRNDHEDVKTAIFFALNKWKEEKYKSDFPPSFEELFDALPVGGYNIHLLCQILKDKKVYENENIALQETPDDKVLVNLSAKLGDCALHLGIELGLSMAEIKRIRKMCKQDSKEETLCVMKEWKKSGEDRTILMLMKALQSADGTGFKTLKENYRV